MNKLEKNGNPVASTEIPDERYDLKILQSLRQIIRAIDIHSRKLSMQHEITAPQLVTLLCVAENGPMTIASISKKVHLSASTLVGIIDRLESKNLVVRKRDTKDRRLVHVHITKEGKKFARKAPSPLQDTLSEALSEVSILEQSTISLALERVVEMMEAKELDASPILETGSISRTDLDKKKS